MSNPTDSALMARIKELEEALRPFAEAADEFDASNPADFMQLDAGGICVGDLRKARQVLDL